MDYQRRDGWHHKQLIEASRAPVVASHDTLRAVAGVGLSDEVLKALAAKGGLVGIHGGAAVIGRRYRQWMAADPENAANAARAVLGMVGHQPPSPRPPGDRREFIAQMDESFRQKWRALGEWKERPGAEAVMPLAQEWAEQVNYVIKTVGAEHVAIGLDFVGRTQRGPKRTERVPRTGRGAQPHHDPG